jgi:hypothetical protein
MTLTLPPPYHFIFALGVVWGAAWAISDSKLTLPLRLAVVARFGDQSRIIQLLECPACLSFWLGIGAGGFMHMGFLGAIAFGIFACGISFILAALTIGVNHHE